jgi:FHA domain-containing protein
LRRPSAAVDPFADLAPVVPPANIDQQFDLLGTGAGATHGDPLKDFEFGLGASSDNPTPASAGGVPAADPMSMFDLLAPAAAAGCGGGLPMQDDLPGVNAAFEAPRMAPVGPPPIPPDFQPMSAPEPALRSKPAPAPLAAAFDAALWQAFCEGAGLHLPMPADPTQAAERMRQVGLVLRAAVAGTHELMAVRASTKYEMRASVTQIQARSNNPLKFAPDVKTSVEQLVQPATRGFLDGPAAMEDAMSDLVGHSIGSVAGMRAALEGLLDRFDPASLESTLGGSMLDNLLPLNRRSRLWELYLQRYRAIREEAQEDFHTLFGTAFVAAYEQQVARLKRAEPGEPRQVP